MNKCKIYDNEVYSNNAGDLFIILNIKRNTIHKFTDAEDTNDYLFKIFKLNVWRYPTCYTIVLDSLQYYTAGQDQFLWNYTFVKDIKKQTPGNNYITETSILYNIKKRLFKILPFNWLFLKGY